MTPEILLFGIKSLIRLGQQGDKALIDYAVDKPIAFPPVRVLKLQQPRNLLNQFLVRQKYNSLTKADPFKDFWDPNGGATHKGAITDKWEELSPEDQNTKYLFAIQAARDDLEALEALGRDVGAKGTNAADQMASHVLIGQWKPENRPISPLGRMALAVAEVGLDFAAADPSIFGTGKSGEKIISAFAIALAKPISDNLNAEMLGTQTELVNGVMVAFVRAGLDTLKSQAGDLVSDEHLAVLMGNVLDPLIAASNAGDAKVQDQLRRILDALAGPAASAAMKTIAENPGAFLGGTFDGSKAAGALVSAVLKEAATEEKVGFVFTHEGSLKLLSAALGVAADKPALFVKTGDGKDKVAGLLSDLTATLARQLEASVDSLAQDKDVDGRALAAGIGAAAIQALGRNADALLGGVGAPWHDAVRTVTTSVLGNLATAILDPKLGVALKRVFSEEELIELGSIVVEGIASNPKMVGASDARSREVVSAVATAIDHAITGKKEFLLKPGDWLGLARAMVQEVSARPGILDGADSGLAAVAAALGQVLAGDKNSALSSANISAIANALIVEVVSHSALLPGMKEEIITVAKAVTAAMAQDKNALLSGADWVEILKAAASEASANPARLFGANYNNQNLALAADTLGLVLRTLPPIPVSGGGTTGLILKGDIIRDAMTIVLRYVSGAPDRAQKYRPLLETATKEISNFVADNPGSFGSNEWLGLIRVVTGNILDGTYDVQLAQLVENPGAGVRLIAGVQAADALLKGGA